MSIYIVVNHSNISKNGGKEYEEKSQNLKNLSEKWANLSQNYEKKRNLDEINEYYLDNLAAELYQTYQNSIYYIEFRGLNNYDSTRRNFFIDNSITDQYVPEFININLIVDEDNATPDINIVSI